MDIYVISRPKANKIPFSAAVCTAAALLCTPVNQNQKEN